LTILLLRFENGYSVHRTPPSGTFSKSLPFLLLAHIFSLLHHCQAPESGGTDRYAHRCSGATVGDSHEGSLKNRGESCLKPAKNTKHKHNWNITQNICTQHNPRRDGPCGPPERPSKALPRARSASFKGSHPPRAGSASLEGSRRPLAGSASLEGSRSLERVPPRSRVAASLERPPPRSRLPHKRTCTRVRAFNALTQQSRAITRLGITPRCCSANSLGGAHPRHCGRLCDEAGVSPVTLCRPL
jgi:hypothetical protein